MVNILFKNIEFDPEKVRIYRELKNLTLGFFELPEKKVFVLFADQVELHVL